MILTEIVKEVLSIASPEELLNSKIPMRLRLAGGLGGVAKTIGAVSFAFGLGDVINSTKILTVDWLHDMPSSPTFQYTPSLALTTGVAFSVGVLMYNGYFQNAARYYLKKKEKNDSH